MKAIVHLGLPKTGTTSIQSMLARNRPALERIGFRYNRTFGLTGQSLLGMRIFALAPYAGTEKNASAFRQTIERMDPAEFTALDDAIRDEIERYPSHTFLFSNEKLFDILPSDEGVAALVAYFAERFERVRYVIYLRRQDLHATSSYAQSANGGNAYAFDDVIEHYARRAAYRYHDGLERLAARAGRESIVVRVYERGQLDDGDVTHDFLNVAGIDRSALAPSEKHHNATWDRSAVAFTQAVAQHLTTRENSVATDPWRMAIMGMQNVQQDRPRVALSKKRAEAFLAGFAEQNEAVARGWLGREDGVLFRDPVTGPDEDVLPEIDVDRMAEITAAILRTGAERADKDRVRIADMQAKLRQSQAANQRLRNAVERLRNERDGKSAKT